MKHILIRGPIGVGKSTLLRRLLAASGTVPGGFATKKAPPRPGDLANVYIHPASQPEEERTRTPANCVGVCSHGHTVEKQPQIFDTVGVSLLRTPENAKLLVMDELGFLEKDAAVFQREVLRCLDGDTLVLATVKDKEVSFLETVCAHPNAEVYSITRENRDELFEQLLPILRDRLGK